MALTGPNCLKCGEPGPHFVKPPLGRFGYYRCQMPGWVQDLPSTNGHQGAAAHAADQSDDRGERPAAAERP